MPTFLDRLHAAPADPLLGLMMAARADKRPDKTDLGVGIYKDESGATPVMAAVKDAERLLIDREGTKAYEGPQGNAGFGEHVARMILGRLDAQHAVYATPGGCGALFIGMQLAQKASPTARLFLSDPSWPNHAGVAQAIGLETQFFPYRSQRDGTPDFDAILSGLADVRPGDVILLQGACHNPTGTDMSPEQWVEMAYEVTRRGLIPFIDVAYQGFGNGLEEDIIPIRTFLRSVPEAIVAYSCSKNFGLYRERTGALLLQAPTSAALDVLKSQASALVRASYSMPPAHGPAIVDTILGDRELDRQWQAELGAMRERLGKLRQQFAAAMVDASGNEVMARLGNERGMFSVLPLSQGATERLRSEHGIYLPGSGRVNIAGLPQDRLADVAAKLAREISQAG